MRLVELERASDIQFNWRPFHLLIILQEMKHIPFADKPAKAAICGAILSVALRCTGYRFRFSPQCAAP